jgi:CheY-like chemotaxis protein
MVYGVIIQSQGHIFLKSESGLGTTFKLIFPPIFVEENQKNREDEEEKPQRGTETVLVVEDEDIVKRMITTSLTGLGYRVYDAQDGDEAISVCKKKERIDMLITDVVMPGMSGRELADNLQLKYKDMKVLFISGYTDDAIGQHGVLDEEISFLQKPFTPQRLAKKIRMVLDNNNGQKT